MYLDSFLGFWNEKVERNNGESITTLNGVASCVQGVEAEAAHEELAAQQILIALL